jgi:hypothetical protein
MAKGMDHSSTQSTDYKGISKAVLITKQVKVLFSAYRRDDFADPEGFVAQLGVVLEKYDPAVIVAVTDPRTGLQRKSDFPPSIAKVVAACEEEMARRETLARYRAMPKFVPGYGTPVREGQGAFANVFVNADAPAYEAMKEWSQSKDVDPREWKWDENGRAGIWVTLTAFSARGGRLMPKTIGSEALAMLARKEREAAGTNAPVEESAP